MDDLDRQLVILLKRGIPVQSSPFKRLGLKLGLDEAEVLIRIPRLIRAGVIGKICGWVQAKRLGYPSSLIALKVSYTKLEEVVQILGGHPGISYLAQRDAEYNLWFTLTASDQKSFDQDIEIIRRSGHEMLVLPALKAYSRGFQEWEQAEAEADVDLTPFDIQLARALNEDFPLRDEPYQELATRLGVAEDKLLYHIDQLIEKKCLSRIAALPEGSVAPTGVRQTVVWQLPEEIEERIAMQLVNFPGVKHVAVRPNYPDFPYSLYVVIQADTLARCDYLITQIEEKIGRWPHLCLTDIKVFKSKSSSMPALQMASKGRNEHG